MGMLGPTGDSGSKGETVSAAGWGFCFTISLSIIKTLCSLSCGINPLLRFSSYYLLRELQLASFHSSHSLAAACI